MSATPTPTCTAWCNNNGHHPCPTDKHVRNRMTLQVATPQCSSSHQAVWSPFVLVTSSQQSQLVSPQPMSEHIRTVTVAQPPGATPSSFQGSTLLPDLAPACGGSVASKSLSAVGVQGSALKALGEPEIGVAPPPAMVALEGSTPSGPAAGVGEARACPVRWGPPTSAFEAAGGPVMGGQHLQQRFCC